MKYEKEIDELLIELFREDWMDDDEHEEVLKLSFERLGITKQKLSESIQVGVDNGHSVEDQFDLIRKHLKPLIK